MYLTQVQIQCKYNAFKYTEYNLNTLKYNVFDPSPNTMNTYLPCRLARPSWVAPGCGFDVDDEYVHIGLDVEYSTGLFTVA